MRMGATQTEAGDTGRCTEGATGPRSRSVITVHTQERRNNGTPECVSVRVLIHPTRYGAEAECFMVGAEDSPST